MLLRRTTPPGVGPRPLGPARPQVPGRAPAGATVGRRLGTLGAAMLKRADANKDGKISLDEVPEQRREGFKRLLERLDKDGDQALSAEEVKGAADAISQRIEEFRKRLLAKPKPEKPREEARRKPGQRRGPVGKQPPRRKPGRRGPGA